MATPKNYPKAPITESIIQLLVKPAERIRLADLARAFVQLDSAYPHRKDVKIGLGLIEMGERVAASASAEHVGYMYASSDEKHVCQVAVDSFSFSRLEPYQSWESFRTEARRLWTAFREHLKPAAVMRQAVRYVNRLDIPGSRFSIGDYLRTQPEIAAGLPQDLAGYFMQLQIPVADIKCNLVLNETIAPSPIAGCTGLILDIDLFRADDLPQDEESIWSFFEVLHDRKNEFFEACITDRARELFR